jgi:hypothetical protein
MFDVQPDGRQAAVTPPENATRLDSYLMGHPEGVVHLAGQFRRLVLIIVPVPLILLDIELERKIQRFLDAEQIPVNSQGILKGGVIIVLGSERDAGNGC